MAEAALAPAYASPAQLRYHPRTRARTLAERALPEGARLLVGDRGERWLFDPRAASLAAGAMLAPESLIAALPEGDAYWFVGASGTSYAARGALGRFERSSAPVEALAGVSAAGSAIVGVRQQRSLLRSSDFGISWAQVGPHAVAFVDVALEPSSGSGLALAVPEALYRTQDYGATWSAANLPKLGVLELEVALDGSVRALTPLGERRWDGAAFVPLKPNAPAPALPEPPRGPDAGALAEGRAALSGARYLELVKLSGRDGWQLLQGPIEGPLSAAPLSEAAGCRSVRLAAFERFVVVACFRGSAEATTQPIDLWQSSDGGKGFARVPGRLDGSLAAFRLAVGAEGQWIASGVCPPGSFGGCPPGGVQIARDAVDRPGSHASRSKGPARSAGAPAATPSLAESALALGFASDGRVAYAVGRRTKTGRFALFVSRDGGRSFEPEDLDLGQLASEDENDDFVERSQATRVESLSAAEDGAVALSFVHYGRRLLVVTDDRGKLLSTAAPPEDRALLAASGLRGIAVAPKSRQVWESLDGGVTWDPAEALPVDLCPGDSACDVPIRCNPNACVVGHEFTRVGWGRAPRDEALLLPPLRPVRTLGERRMLATIACTLEANAFRPLLGVTEGPSAVDAAIGAAAWYAVAEDPNHASVTVYHANKGRLESVRLLEPVQRPEEYAYAVVDQVEGVAAVRYRLPEAVPGKTNLTEVEVAWDDLLAGRVGRARLADGGPSVPGDFSVGRGRARRAQPELTSIASGGVYLRLHARAADQPTLFLDGKRVESLPPVEFPRDPRFTGRLEMVHANGVHAPIWLVGSGAAVVRARRDRAGFAFDAVGTGMIDPAAFGIVQLTNIAYASGRAGLHLEVRDETGSGARGMIFPFRGEGDVVDPPVPVPTQRGLGERPVGCDADVRKRTPRVISPEQAGTQHAVVVSDAALGPRTLSTSAAVLYGTVEAPCVAAYSALSAPVDGAQSAREGALILMDDLEHSVLFRVGGERENARIEYRYMACHFDPALEAAPP